MTRPGDVEAIERRPLPSPIDCELRQRCQWQRGRVWYIEVRGRAWYIEVCVLTFLAQRFIYFVQKITGALRVRFMCHVCTGLHTCGPRTAQRAP